MLEFKDGKHTGRTIDADIIYMLEDYTGLTAVSYTHLTYQTLSSQKIREFFLEI